MSKAVDLLKGSAIFYLATVDNDQPRVRPFGAVAEINGKLYLCTANTKDVFKQIQANPKVEISAVLGQDTWLRISGTVEVDPSLSAREEFLNIFPLPRYKADDGIFEIFFFTKGVATVYSLTGKQESFEL